MVHTVSKKIRVCFDFQLVFHFLDSGEESVDFRRQIENNAIVCINICTNKFANVKFKCSQKKKNGERKRLHSSKFVCSYEEKESQYSFSILIRWKLRIVLETFKPILALKRLFLFFSETNASRSVEGQGERTSI